MTLDVYYCTVCEEDFAVKKEKEPQYCPYCKGEVTWGHDTEEGE